MIYFSFKTKYFVKKTPKNYLINAKNKILGRLCSNTIKYLIGKHLPTYTPNYNYLNNIIIINANKIKFNKKKIKKKIYYKYTGYIGNKKKYTMDFLLKKNPCLLVKLSLYRMLPKNILGEHAKKKIYIYKDNNYKRLNSIKEIKI
ncbi:MAG: 50S ribosomal protein L13 [Candidatus Shikimatogenerans bostrichidophilus]|nr:MAG: 50S ribosomal protein L13 [Candidatus Shikimatogenerans bostrichidophilus]